MQSLAPAARPGRREQAARGAGQLASLADSPLDPAPIDQALQAAPGLIPGPVDQAPVEKPRVDEPCLDEPLG
jgi:hypothetical protein